MTRMLSIDPLARPTVAVHTARTLPERLPAIERFLAANAPGALSRHPSWSFVLQESLGHEIYSVEAQCAGATCGYLPLAFVRSAVFGKFLVSLPYLNSGGVVAANSEIAAALIGRAVTLADDLEAKHLELRHERAFDDPALNAANATKVHMRLPLPSTLEDLWKGFEPKVRNQIRKGEKHSFPVRWGGEELLEPFHEVLSINMRDLGTPVYGIELFRSILRTFPGAAEIAVLTAEDRPIAAALLLHGRGVTEVPTASSLREFNPTCANMVMYHHLLRRAVERGQSTFDFGRSTRDGATFKFKKQWGADAHRAVWQYRLRGGAADAMRPDNPRYRHAIRLWRKLPLGVTRALGPHIVRGIP